MKIAIGDLELRSFEASDARALYTIRNHPSVLPYMTSPTAIPYRSHVAWVKQHLIDRHDIVLFMIRLRGRPIGLSLLRPVGDETEIGLMVREPEKYPFVPVYGAVTTLHYAFTVLGLDAVVSYALEMHDRAHAMSLAFGAEEVESDKPGQMKFRLRRAVGLADATYRKYLGRLERRMVVTA